MEVAELERAFDKIGAKINVSEATSTRWSRMATPSVDVRDETFELRFNGEEELASIRLGDIKPGMRHLLLKIDGASVLCGHDERHWFAASVPGAPSGVSEAMDHLKPAAVREAEQSAGIGTSKKHKRRNAARKRQGEWFFIPRPDLDFDDLEIGRNEMLQRNASSKAHVCEEMCAPTGETVMVNFRTGKQLSVKEYEALETDLRTGYTARTLTDKVYVRGAVRHPDHATLTLNCWHEVVLSQEGAAGVGRVVTFLD